MLLIVEATNKMKENIVAVIITRAPVTMQLLTSRNIESLGKHRDSRKDKTNCFPREQTLSALLYIQKMNKLNKHKRTNKPALTTARLSTTLFLLNTANVRQLSKMHRKRSKEPTYFPGIFEILLL